MPTESHWVCEQCSRPIELGQTGFIEFTNGNPNFGPVGGQPRRAAPEEEQQDSVVDMQTIAADLSEEIYHLPYVVIRVYHQDCDPDPGDEGYWVYVSSVATLELWIGLILELGNKVWCGKLELEHALLFWWIHKNENPPQFAD